MSKYKLEITANARFDESMNRAEKATRTFVVPVTKEAYGRIQEGRSRDWCERYSPKGGCANCALTPWLGDNKLECGSLWPDAPNTCVKLPTKMKVNYV